MTPILLYSHEKEPVTRALLSSKLDQKYGLIKLSLDTLLNQAIIIDEVSENGTKLNWTLPSGQQISNTNDFYLINRVLFAPGYLFKDFSEEDRLYAVSEFRAYLSFAIESFPCASSKPGAFGLSDNRYSLPRQWEMIRNSNHSLKSPDYYIGNMNYCKLDGDLVYTNPFDFYFWRPNRSLVDLEQASFAFSKPQGQPVVACTIGPNIRVFPCDLKESISANTQSLVIENTLKLSKLFNYPVAEILFFSDNQALTFGMISSIPYASNRKPWFQEQATSYFDEVISGKYGNN